MKVVVHSDIALMPPNSKSWATFNMVLSEAQLGEQPAIATDSKRQSEHAAMCSVWMNRFHEEWNTSTPIIQTINPFVMPSQEKVIATANLQRPVVSKESFGLWKRLGDLQNEPGRKIWFVGSYASAGVPLLETGVTSAKQVAKKIGALLAQSSV